MHESKHVSVVHKVTHTTIPDQKNFQDVNKILFLEAASLQHNIKCCDSANDDAELILLGHITEAIALYEQHASP